MVIGASHTRSGRIDLPRRRSIGCGNPDVFPLWRSDRPVRRSDHVRERSRRTRELLPTTVHDRIGRAPSQEVSLLHPRIDPGRSGRNVEAAGGGRGGDRLAGTARRAGDGLRF
jgi:hypothetical protein